MTATPEHIVKTLRIEARHIDVARSIGDDDTVAYGTMCPSAADLILSQAARIADLEEALKPIPETQMDRSEDFRAGFRNAHRRCVAWLHSRAGTMNDQHAVVVLNNAADDLGKGGI